MRKLGYNGEYRLTTFRDYPIYVGDEVTDIHGRTSIVTGGIAPSKPKTWGLIETTTGTHAAFYYECVWIKVK